MKNIVSSFELVLAFLLVSTLASPQIQQNCTIKSRSQCGIPTQCDVSPPLPLEATVTIKLSKKIWWNGQDSWFFAIQSAKGRIEKLDGYCMKGQSQGGEYGQGANITLHFGCKNLPRQLEKGDKIWMYVFADQKNPDYWLMMNIPIPGISSEQSLQQMKQYTFKDLLQKIQWWGEKALKEQTQK